MSGPWIVVSALLESGAKVSAITLSHGDAMERGVAALGAEPVAGLEMVELTLDKPAFSSLRRAILLPPTTVGVHDLFAVSGTATVDQRKAAAFYLAQTSVQTLQAQGMLGSSPAQLQMTLPGGWKRSSLEQRVKESGVLDLTPGESAVFRTIKDRWDSHR